MLKNLLLLCLVAFCISFCLSLLVNRDIKIALLTGLINLIATFIGAVVVNRQQRTSLRSPMKVQMHIQQLERRKHQLIQTLSAMAAGKHRTEANLGFLKAELSQMYTQSVEQRSYQQQLNQNLIQLQEYKSRLEAELQDLQTQIQNLKQSREEMYKSLRYNKTEQNQKEGANRLSVQLQQLQAEIAKRQNQKQELERNLALLNELTPQLEEKSQSLQIQIQKLENRKAELNRSLELLTTTIQRTEVRLNSLHKKFSHIQQQVAEQQKAKETLTAELVTLNQQKLEILTAVESPTTLPDEWQEFTRRLPEYELQILKALVEPGNPSTKIRKIAEENITMPELLIDLLNDRAFNILGDLIVEPGLGTSPPKIPEEYLTKVKQVVNTTPRGFLWEQRSLLRQNQSNEVR